MNGDQVIARNNAFSNVPKKNHHSQEIIILFRFFFGRELKNKIIFVKIDKEPPFFFIPAILFLYIPFFIL